MIGTENTIRFFISSTFYDMQQERNALQLRVFPRLREFCRKQGVRFQPIDLRWGVSQEASQDHRTLAICLEEIRRCREVSPHFNFLVLLGERHGSALLPEQIDQDEFERLLNHAGTTDERDTIKLWYQLDRNARPPIYVLQPRSKEQYPTYKCWEPVQQRLHTILATACQRAQFDVAAQLKYLASATELEIEAGVFKYSAEEQQPLCFFRTIDGVPKDAKQFVEQDSKKSTRLESIKCRLEKRSSDFYKYRAQWAGEACSEEHLEAFCETAKQRLEARIKAILDRPQQRQATETSAFQQLMRRTRHFVGRDEALTTIKTYLASAASSPLVVTGPSGSGKSTLLAHAAKKAKDALREKHAAVVEDIYIGVTPDSSNTHLLLTNLWSRIREAYNDPSATSGGKPIAIPTDEHSLIEKLPDLLQLARADKPLLLFIDALDQLREGSQRHWIPRRLPSYVHIIVSTQSGPRLDMLQQELPTSHLLLLKAMTQEEGNQLLTLWLEEEAQRTLQPEQRKAVLEAFVTHGLPLYLRIAFEEARRWPSYKQGGLSLKPDIPGILQDLFERLARPGYHGPKMVAHSLGYLRAAKNGLSEDELLDLLRVDEEVLADIKSLSPESPIIELEALSASEEIGADRTRDPLESNHKLPFPVVLWSRLFFDLSPYLTERSADGANLIGFYHQQLGEVVNEMYLLGDLRRVRHHTLAEYFKKQPLVEGTAQNLRKMTEQPFQQTEGGQWDDLYETLTDFRFLEEKARTGKTLREGPDEGILTLYTGVYELQEDFDRALVKMPPSTVISIRENEAALIIYADRKYAGWSITFSYNPGPILPLMEGTVRQLRELVYWEF